VHCSSECTPPDLSTGISNLLQPAQAEVVLGHLSTYLASWIIDSWGKSVRTTILLYIYIYIYVLS
jgi:hypothetical protein